MTREDYTPRRRRNVREHDSDYDCVTTTYRSTSTNKGLVFAKPEVYAGEDHSRREENRDDVPEARPRRRQDAGFSSM